MPKPLAYLQLDANYEHVLRWARGVYEKKGKKDQIKHLKYWADPQGDIKGTNLAMWERFVTDYLYCLQNFRSVFVDTLTELVTVRKIAQFGRDTQILQLFYGAIYADLRFLVKEALNSDCNVGFVHRSKKLYRNDEWTGDYELQGWGDVVYETQVHLVHDRDDEGNFSTQIKECAQDARLMGYALEKKENTFVGLATKIYPNTEEGDWQ